MPVAVSVWKVWLGVAVRLGGLNLSISTLDPSLIRCLLDMGNVIWIEISGLQKERDGFVTFFYMHLEIWWKHLGTGERSTSFKGTFPLPVINSASHAGETPAAAGFGMGLTQGIIFRFEHVIHTITYIHVYSIDQYSTYHTYHSMSGYIYYYSKLYTSYNILLD